MTPVPPAISVVIPTCGRPQSLRRAIDALGRQDVSFGPIEILVVADGNDAVAAEALRAIPPQSGARVIALGRRRGAAAARNAGALEAAAPLLLFLDDDIEVWGSCVKGHIEAQRAGSATRAVVGYLEPRVEGHDFFAIALRGWWEAMFEAMRSVGHRFHYRDLLTGNFSIPAGAFHRAGGFDEALECHEDYEFGARLLASGVELAFSDRAAGVHHEGTRLRRSLDRKRAEGAADVQILRRHPHLLPSLPLGWFETHASRRQRWLRALVFRQPDAAVAVAKTMERGLATLEAARLRGRWHRLLDDLLTCYYWLGVNEVLPGREQVERLRANCLATSGRPEDAMVIDLAGAGFSEASALVDSRRPGALQVLWDGQPVGEIRDAAGAERLRGVHLRRALVEELALPLLGVLNAREVIRLTRSPEGAMTTQAVPRAPLAAGRS